MKMKKILPKNYPGLLVTISIFVIWWIVSETGLIGKTLIATPAEVWEVIVQAFSLDARTSEKFQLHALATISRALIGWFIAGISGIFFGVLIGSVYRLYTSTEIVSEFIRAIPPILAFPLLLVAFNYGEKAYIWTIVFGCFPVMLLTVAKGVINVPQSRLDVMKVFNIKPSVSSFIKAMEIMPSVFLGSRLTLTIAVTIAVVTEMVFTPRNGLSLGALARDSEIDFNTPMFYTCVIAIGLFGYIANLLLRKLEERFDPFSDRINDIVK